MKKYFMKKVLSVLLAGAVLVSGIPAAQTRAAHGEEAQSIVYEAETYHVTGKITNEWKNHYQGEIILENTGKEKIENWKLIFESQDEFENMWNAKIEAHEGNTYIIKNCGYNQVIQPGEKVSIGFQAGYIQEKDMPDSFRMPQYEVEELGEKCRLTFDVESKWKEGCLVKVGLLDSGVDYSDTLSVVERENFVETYDDSNILYDDLSGHGTAVAGIMGAKRENRDREEEDGEAGEPGEPGEEVPFDGSFLTERDKCVSVGVPQEIPEGFTEPEAEEAAAESEDVSAGAEEEELPEFRYAANYADHYAQIDGVNPNVRIYSARVLDEKNHAPIERVIQGIEWAVAQGVDILNISWGTDRDDERLHRAVKSASDKGILIIAAAGNGEEIQYPARYEEVMAVGSVNARGEKAEQSAEGRQCSGRGIWKSRQGLSAVLSTSQQITWGMKKYTATD